MADGEGVGAVRDEVVGVRLRPRLIHLSQLTRNCVTRIGARNVTCLIKNQIMHTVALCLSRKQVPLLMHAAKASHEGEASACAQGSACTAGARLHVVAVPCEVDCHQGARRTCADHHRCGTRCMVFAAPCRASTRSSRPSGPLTNAARLRAHFRKLLYLLLAF